MCVLVFSSDPSCCVCFVVRANLVVRVSPLAQRGHLFLSDHTHTLTHTYVLHTHVHSQNHLIPISLSSPVRDTENPINVTVWITAAQSTGSYWVETQWICQLTSLVKGGEKSLIVLVPAPEGGSHPPATIALPRGGRARGCPSPENQTNKNTSSSPAAVITSDWAAAEQ